MLIVLGISLFIFKGQGTLHFQSNNTITVYLLLFLLIWATGLAILPSLPNPFPGKGLVCLMGIGLVTHGIFISGRIIEGHGILPSFSVFSLDIAITALLLKILSIKRLSLRWAFLYIVNPCVLAGLLICQPSAFAAILLFISAVYFFLTDRYKLMFALTGFHAVFFPYSIPAIFLLLNKRNYKKAWILLISLAASLLISFLTSRSNLLPFYALNAEAAIKTGVLSHFMQPAFHVQNVDTISYVLAFLFSTMGVIIFHPELNPRYRNDPFHGIFIFFATLIILLPEPPISIFIWIAPFIVFRPSIMWLLLGFSAFPYAAVSGLSASIPGLSPSFQIFCGVTHLKSIVWFPLYISLPFAFYRMVQHHKNYSRFVWQKEIKTLSVIIPVLNEESGIGQCIRSIRQDSSVTEIIVIDGGSNDNTANIAKNEEAEVIIHKLPFTDGGGRGGQIKAGLFQASGDAVAIIHADSIISAPIFNHIIDTLNNNPDVIGGAVGCRFDSDELKFRAIEFANNARMAYLGIAFGDQIQFFRRRPVIENNAFPDIPLMEDVELSMRLKNLGTQVFLFGDVMVSTRRWQKKGFKNALWVIRQVTKYIITRIWAEPDSSSLYKAYYKVKND
ncbi:glycosyltransferase [Desulforegula conservatrix]|uniref:glycosyltransferase n=1 Tax=Desulforegula conservatrix TaxID=153026 RepID=UPI00041F2108|nr:glycosyltransferase [Desulforegula conservatrix]